MSKYPDRQSQNGRDGKPTKSGIKRRHIIALAAGSIAAPSLLGSLASKAKADATSGNLIVAPRYYPLGSGDFNPEINLRGKLAVITGASRGIGRAVGEALTELGVDVIGTSRNPNGVPNPPKKIPLLALDITNPTSVLAFREAIQSHNTFRKHGSVDILVNNAGRNVVGRISPLPPTDFDFYLSQRDLGVRTLYSGHVMVTNVMLPLMAQSGYSRIMFTVSVASYFSGATFGAGSYTDVYFASKAALRIYANNLRAALQAAGSIVRVSTVNPYTIKTTLSEHPNPIYTQPVNSSGFSDTDPLFNEVISLTRQIQTTGLPPSMVGETYVQLLSMANPEPNVVVSSPREPLATQGTNAIIEGQILAENQISAVPLKCK